jgi:hypothetical protein
MNILNSFEYVCVIVCRFCGALNVNEYLWKYYCNVYISVSLSCHTHAHTRESDQSHALRVVD